MQKNFNNFFSSIYFVTDIFIIIISYIISDYLKFDKISFNSTNVSYILSLIIIWFFSSKLLKFYEIHRTQEIYYKIIEICNNLIIYFLIISTLSFIFKIVTLSRMMTIIFFVILFILLVLSHLTLNFIILKVQMRDSHLKRLLIIGAGRVGISIFKSISFHPEYGYNIIGYLDDDPESKELNSQIIGTIDDTEKVIRELSVHEVIIAFPIRFEDKVKNVINICERAGVRVRVVPDIYRITSRRIELGTFSDIPILSIHPVPLENILYRLVKRLFDIVFSSFILFITSPILLFIAIVIKLTSNGPILFIQKRTGYNQKVFNCLKFRSMAVMPREIADKQQATENDPRVTKIGSFIRKTNIDEFPQFINVLKGDMSVVGPRPHMINQNPEFMEAEKQYLTRHLIKPGITGWAQVNGWRGPTDTKEKIQKRVEFDIWYMENWNFWFDIQIILMTVFGRKSKLNAF